MRTFWLFFTILMIIVAVIGLGFMAANAMAEDGHAKHHNGFYKHLMIPGTNASCCNDRDCRPVEHRFDQQDGFQVKIGGAWLTPPRERIMVKVTPDGAAHWCGVGHSTFCAIQPFTGY